MIGKNSNLKTFFANPMWQMCRVGLQFSYL